MLAWAGDLVVGLLFFFPKSLFDNSDAGGMCLMMDYPAGPSDDFFKGPLPTIEKIQDKTLVINCMMTGSSQQKENPYQRTGVGTRMVDSLILWAREKGWHHIEVEAFEDLPIVYKITGSAGITFWEKLGFVVADRHPHPHLVGHDEFVETLETQAQDLGIAPERARDRIIMRFDLQA